MTSPLTTLSNFLFFVIRIADGNNGRQYFIFLKGDHFTEYALSKCASHPAGAKAQGGGLQDDLFEYIAKLFKLQFFSILASYANEKLICAFYKPVGVQSFDRAPVDSYAPSLKRDFVPNGPALTWPIYPNS